MESKEEQQLTTHNVPPTSEPKPEPGARPEDSGTLADTKARVDAVWQQMNKGVSSKTLKSILNNHANTTSTANKNSCPKGSSSQGWMTYLGLGSKKVPSASSLSSLSSSPGQGEHHSSSSDDAKKLAAAALSAVRDAAAAASLASNRGKVEFTEVRDFAGEEIEVKKFVDADAKEVVSDKAKGPAGPSSAVDAVLEQIKKKQKLSVLDKTKKDWCEFKEETKGLEEELDAYKKSSNQYLDKVSFLQRTDMREFERERDARLALQAKRKPEMREDL